MVRPEDAAAALDELGTLAELTGDSFRGRAYHRAARAVEQLDGTLEERLADGTVKDLPGVGEGILKKLQEFVKTGRMKKAEEYRKKVPAGVGDLIRVPGLGPKRAMQLSQELGIDSLAKLKQAAEQGKLQDLKGFGAKRQADILAGLQVVDQVSQRLTLPEAQRIADEVVAALQPNASQLAWAGSLRRRRDTVGDIDFVGVPKPRGAKALAEALMRLDGASVLAQGESKVSVRLPSGLQVDLRIMKEAEFGAALVYFTGSKAHNIKLRALAIKRGWKLNEYGLFEERDGKEGKRLAGKTEEDVYAKLGLPVIVPELREDQGEVEAALEGKLPKLVEERDLRGDLHTHCNASDGLLTPEQWVEAAARSGLAYVGLTDHSAGLPGWGRTGPELVAHRAKVLELADNLGKKVRVFVGTEANITKDGGLDLEPKYLDQLDYVVAGVHTHFSLDEAAMTKRIVKALKTGRIHILSHPTGRKLGERPPFALDAEQVFRAAAESGTALELNCQPDRLDLDGSLAKKARDLGCRFSIDSDCHGAPKRELLRWGLDQARRGWLEPKDVVNALPPDQVLKALARR